MQLNIKMFKIKYLLSLCNRQFYIHSLIKSGCSSISPKFTNRNNLQIQISDTSWLRGRLQVVTRTVKLRDWGFLNQLVKVNFATTTKLGTVTDSERVVFLTLWFCDFVCPTGLDKVFKGDIILIWLLSKVICSQPIN